MTVADPDPWFHDAPVTRRPGCPGRSGATLQRIADVLPITPLIETMRRVALEGAGIAELGAPMRVLAAWVPVSLVRAVVLPVRARVTATVPSPP